MYFVPEGQHDSSQARSAWSHQENSPVPAGRLNGSGLRLDASNKNVLLHEILGSLGQMRFFGFVEWRGGPIAREVKLSRPSAWAWAQGKTSAGNAIMTLIDKAVRSPDPLVSMHDNWLVRAIAAECGRIDLDEVDKAGIDAQRRDDHQRLLSRSEPKRWSAIKVTNGSFLPGAAIPPDPARSGSTVCQGE